MEDDTDIARIVRDVRQIKMGIWLVLALGLTLLAGQIFVLVKVADLLKATTAGTEPPIRVRGGSMHFELLAGGSTFTSKTGKTTDTDWTVEPGFRYGDNVNAMIATPTAMANCPLVNIHAGKITFEYKSSASGITNKVTIHSQSKKTTIKADNPLTLESDGTLTFDKDNTGFISSIKTPGGVNCSFTSLSQLTDVTITE
jgi:hypothetical protein